MHPMHPQVMHTEDGLCLEIKGEQIIKLTLG